ncbi:hypothetical protein CEXT_615211 [Caerostris extrusa]|uniref:Uncharacterized protein n=1 Tax=Caerostris extrusa TaxID=172846 RepID=A0AAV4PLX5_CAEEX|nr:hypothetical protein CEXT_615211 [Caerostris extrusa]
MELENKSYPFISDHHKIHPSSRRQTWSPSWSQHYHTSEVNRSCLPEVMKEIEYHSSLSTPVRRETPVSFQSAIYST